MKKIDPSAARLATTKKPGWKLPLLSANKPTISGPATIPDVINGLAKPRTCPNECRPK